MRIPVDRTAHKSRPVWWYEQYDGSLRAERGNGHGGWVEIRFSTNPKGLRHQKFTSAVYPKDFKELARIMMKVDPAEAIKAFGAAMQEISNASVCASENAAE